jgi:hypothetical protein
MSRSPFELLGSGSPTGFSDPDDTVGYFVRGPFVSLADEPCAECYGKLRLASNHSHGRAFHSQPRGSAPAPNINGFIAASSLGKCPRPRDATKLRVQDINRGVDDPAHAFEDGEEWDGESGRGGIAPQKS